MIPLLRALFGKITLMQAQSKRFRDRSESWIFPQSCIYLRPVGEMILADSRIGVKNDDAACGHQIELFAPCGHQNLSFDFNNTAPYGMLRLKVEGTT
jgi:hypothetical protein